MTPARQGQTSLMVDRPVHKGVRVAAVTDDRAMLDIANEALVEWLFSRGHELPEGWHVDRRTGFASRL